MANEIVKPHKFEVAKNEIQKLAHNVPSTVSFKQFPTEGSIFSWNDHNITGDEANRLLVSPLQSTLINQNTNIRNLLKIADEVYKALESLDKEYISGIVAAVKSAEEASNQAKTASSKAERASEQALSASNKALEASNKATLAQTDIKRTIDALKATVQILKDFKENVTKDLTKVSYLNTQVTSVSESVKVLQSIKPYLTSLNHIKDIDVIWRDQQSSQSAIIRLDGILTPFISRVNNSDKEIREAIARIQRLIVPISHLSDIDAIWNDVKSHKTNLADFHKQVDDFVSETHTTQTEIKQIINQTTERIDSDIKALQNYRSVLESYQHLGDVDAIWSDVESHKTNLADFHKQVDDFVSESNETQNKIKRIINQTTERIDSDIKALQDYRSVLESYQHLGDVDAIWSDVESHKTNLADFHKQVDDFVSETHTTQTEIKQIINQTTERIDSDIKALQDYRSVLESYQHLGDVDAIWSDVKSHKANLADFHKQVDDFVSETHTTQTEIKQIINQTTERIDSDIKALQDYRSVLESYQHLGDVDAIWSDVESHKTNLADFHKQVDGFVSETHTTQTEIKQLINQTTERIDSDIKGLQEYRSELESYEHLGDVDAIWSDVESHKTNLAVFHKQVDDFILEVHTTQTEIKDSIKRLEEENASAHLKYEKRIKIAYYVGGGAVGLSLINYILQLLGIL